STPAWLASRFLTRFGTSLFAKDTELRYHRLVMERPFKQIEFEQHGDVYCVRLAHTQLDEAGLEELSAEIARLIDENGCRKMVMSLGPEDPLCLYSVFLAKLVNLQ